MTSKAALLALSLLLVTSANPIASAPTDLDEVILPPFVPTSAPAHNKSNDGHHTEATNAILLPRTPKIVQTDVWTQAAIETHLHRVEEASSSTSQYGPPDPEHTRPVHPRQAPCNPIDASCHPPKGPFNPANAPFNDPISPDTLNVTRCYCASPNWRQDNWFGYHHTFNYYNGHFNKSFSMDWQCASNKATHLEHGLHPYSHNKCVKKHQHRKGCLTNPGEPSPKPHLDRFCYKIRDFPTLDKDRYTINKWQFDLPRDGIVDSYPTEVKETCETLCQEIPGSNLTMLWGQDFIEALPLIGHPETAADGWYQWSYIKSYTKMEPFCRMDYRTQLVVCR